jgi:hypothetical protein
MFVLCLLHYFFFNERAQRAYFIDKEEGASYTTSHILKIG